MNEFFFTRSYLIALFEPGKEGISSILQFTLRTHTDFVYLWSELNGGV